MTIADRHSLAVARIAGAEAADRVLTPERREASGPFPPIIERADLTPQSLTGAIEAGGCALVPALLHEDVVAELIDGIDRAFAAYDRHEGAAGTGDPYFEPFVDVPGLIHTTRPWLRGGGGIFTADSPLLSDRWFGLLHELGVTGLVESVFDEVPVTSLDKCALRRISAGDGIEWHQDGSFLGATSGALNLWVSLTDTTDAPGLDIVARRFTEIVETGTGGASYDWSTGPEVIERLARSTPIERPHFRAGDALIFDGLLLHRTAQEPPVLPATRYAIETWFFRPSRFPDHQEIPLAF